LRNTCVGARCARSRCAASRRRRRGAEAVRLRVEADAAVDAEIRTLEAAESNETLAASLVIPRLESEAARIELQLNERAREELVRLHRF
jgi:hypothetical protein